MHRQRRDDDRERDLRSEDRRRRRHGAHVDEHPRPQLAPLERGEVLAQRDLVSRATGEVRVRVGVELLLREPLVVPDVDRIQRRRSLNLTRACGNGPKKGETRLREPQTGFRLPGGMRGEPAGSFSTPPRPFPPPDGVNVLRRSAILREPRRSGRVAEGGALLRRYGGECLHRGFESLLLRFVARRGVRVA